jgi:predicted MPP superfamily phosphohydrolase
MRLEVGSHGSLLVREEEVHLTGAARATYRILYASDLHFAGERGERLIGQMVQAVTQTRPNLILFGGDLVDDPWGLRSLQDCVSELRRFAPVACVPGNHDRSFGLPAVRKAVTLGGGTWLDQEPSSFLLGNEKVRLDGKLDPGSGGIKVLCAHYPDVFPKAAAVGYRLVLAGHLHGGQCVLWRAGNLLYPGVWFYRWNGLRFQEGEASLIVSRGVSDSMPIRWNCPREVILCGVY